MPKRSKMMKRAMITVCGEFGDKYWVSATLLTSACRLSQKLADLGFVVEVAQSMDNAQMKNLVKGVASEVTVARELGVNHLFVLFRDDSHRNNLFEVFTSLRQLLPENVGLTLVELANADKGLTLAEKVKLERRGCRCIYDANIKSQKRF